MFANMFVNHRRGKNINCKKEANCPQEQQQIGEEAEGKGIIDLRMYC